MRYCRYRPVRNLSNAIVVVIRDVKISTRIHGDAERRQGSGRCRTAITRKGSRPVSRYRRDDAAADFSDASTRIVSDIEVAVTANSKGHCVANLGCNGGSVVSAETDYAVAGYCRDSSVDVYFSYPSCVGDIQIPGTING